MKRREFINWAGLGFIASYLPVALVACSQTDSEAENITDYVSLGTVEQLEAEGFLLNEEAKAMVVKNSQDELVAVNPTCTHQGCIVDWEKDAYEFVCPCHNAKFAFDGKVLAKPAPEPLSSYEVTNKNNEILVKLT